ncbi:MAG: hypothetical protein Q9208_004952 [Pyrenodesmia sp. 3 TL-2023]
MCNLRLITYHHCPHHYCAIEKCLPSISLHDGSPCAKKKLVPRKPEDHVDGTCANYCGRKRCVDVECEGKREDAAEGGLGDEGEGIVESEMVMTEGEGEGNVSEGGGEIDGGKEKGKRWWWWRRMRREKEK